MTIVMGAGAFGTALAISLVQNGAVTLWAREEDHARELRRTRQNARRLPGVDLPAAMQVTSELPSASGVPYLLSVPMQKLRAALETHRAALSAQILIACCKGMELESGLSPTQVIREVIPDAIPAILTGPSFAADIARGLPTALTLACEDDQLGKKLQDRLGTATLRLYRTTDVTGAELGGALKNVMAIACGAVMGAGLGESARAALMTRGFAEMCRMAETRGARASTLGGLSGFGDLALTCTSSLSRNYQFGLSLGQGEPFDPNITVEGAATAQAVLAEAQKAGVDMPITQAVAALSAGKLQVAQAMDMLLSRPQKEE